MGKGHDVEAAAHSHDHDHGHSHGHSHGHDHGHGGSCDSDSDADSHGHGKGHGHGKCPTDRDQALRADVLRRLKLASLLCLLFLLVEVAGGIYAGSLAVLSDAAHLFSDLASFIVAVAAGHLASLPGSPTYTFGYRRVEALAALFSMVSLAVVSLFLMAEGMWRLWPYLAAWWEVGDGGIGGAEDVGEDVNGRIMSAVALVGVRPQKCDGPSTSTATSNPPSETTASRL